MKCATDSVKCYNDSVVGNWRDGRGRAVHQGADEATCLYVTRGQGVVSPVTGKNICALNQPTEYESAIFTNR